MTVFQILRNFNGLSNKTYSIRPGTPTAGTYSN